MQCPACQHENNEAARFCVRCGARLALACPSCGEEVGPQARFCSACGAALSQPAPLSRGERRPHGGEEPSAPDGERRQLTVLFCDLVGSTPLSQQLDPEEWRNVVAQYQQAAATAVTRFGGHVAKQFGDGVLVYFGWPDAREDDPERAVRAGLAILDAMVPLNARLVVSDGIRLAVRIGMHTGPVVIADGGEVFGETPNVGARVQAAAAPDTVVITAATQRLVAGIFVVEDRGPQALKGLSEPVNLYRIVQPSGVRSRLDVAAGRLTRFVGREVELATLVDRWERAVDGEGQNVLVVGEAGVGKSRLVYQLRGRLAAVPHTWLECGATPYTEATPFYPVIALVSKGLAFTPEDTAAAKLAKLETGLRAATSAEPVALLADFLGLPPPTPLDMSPELQRRKTMELLAHWNLAMSEVQPLVLLIEDLHWCDASSLELLGRLIAQSPTARVLLLATARPEFTPPWPPRENMTTLQLARLTKRQARDMVQALCAGIGERASGAGLLPDPRPLTPEILDALVARADGVPLYVEELTKATVEPGATRGVEAIPATLADSLMARLDRLSAAKEVAQQAAVLGREFAYRLLAAVAEQEEAALRQGLTKLVEAEILFVRGEPPDAMYTFKHALVQEAAYGSLLKRTRQQLHGRVVDVLAAEFPERAAAEPEVVARHAEVAGRIDDAIAAYQRAGEQAQAHSAHEEAIRHLRHASALLATRPEGRARDAREVVLQLALGGSLIAARGFAHPEVEAPYERARVLCEAAGDATRLALAFIGLSYFYHNRGEVERARELATRALTSASPSSPSEVVLAGRSQVAACEYYLGQSASALAHCEAAQPLYERRRDHAVVPMLPFDHGVAILAYAGWNLWQLGWPDSALTRAREAVELARQLSHPFSLAYALFFETVVHWIRRDVTAQRERAAEAIALSEAQGFPLWLAVSRTFHAAARAAAGEPGATTDMLAGLTSAAETGSQVGASAMFAMLGEAYMSAGQPAEARAAIETGLGIAAQTGQIFWDADLYRLQGEIVLASGGAPADAEARIQRALDIARAQEAKSLELRAATSLARLWRDQGQRAAAHDLLAPLYAWFTEGFDTGDLVAAQALLADLE